MKIIYSYDELLEMKNTGVKLNFDEITKEQLEYLFLDEGIINSDIARLYDVDAEKVRRKRRKFDITIYSSKYLYNSYVKNNHGLFDKLNDDMKEKILKEENIDMISKAITHHIFRNGPIEDMHANKQLSQDDMKILNKYMVNKLAGILKLVCDGEWLKLGLMLDFLSNYGTDWDPAVCDTEDFDKMLAYSFGFEDK